jgi:hypothetical protein
MKHWIKADVTKTFKNQECRYNFDNLLMENKKIHVQFLWWWTDYDISNLLVWRNYADF